jgi:hypothetical protein
MDIITALLAASCLFGGLLAKLFLGEVQDWLPTVARYVVRRAASRVPEQYRQRYLEEWYADLNAFPGRLSKLIRALGCLLGTQNLRKELSARSVRERSTLPSIQSTDEEWQVIDSVTLQKLAKELELPDEGFRGNIALLLTKELLAALERFKIPIDTSINVKGPDEAPNKLAVLSLKSYLCLREQVHTAFRRRWLREIRAEALTHGYEGEACGECGNFTLVRHGACFKCNTCGSTTGCS